MAKTWGREMSAEEVFSVVLQDRPFYAASGGGITLSGGEPALFPDFAAELLGLCRRESIGTAMETNGVPGWENYHAFLQATDLFLFDYKMTDPAAHRRWTGADLGQVLVTLDRLAEAKKRIILRCPVVPGVNDDDGHLKGIAELSRRYGLPVQVMPYHGTASDKWKALGLENVLAGKPSMSGREAEAVLSRLAGLGLGPERATLP
jgi:pyruvate formate lyase activating enzyme